MDNKATDPKFLAKVRKRFEDISYYTGREYKVDNPNEFPLDKWTLRDFVAEAHYEMLMRSDDLHDQDDRNEYDRYKRFVNAYKDLLTDDIKSYEKHGDYKYDLMESKNIKLVNKEKLQEATILALQGKLTESDDNLKQNIQNELDAFVEANPGKSDYFFEHDFKSNVLDEYNKSHNTDYRIMLDRGWTGLKVILMDYNMSNIESIYKNLQDKDSYTRSPGGNRIILSHGTVRRANAYDFSNDSCPDYTNYANQDMQDFKDWLEICDGIKSNIDRS